MTLGLDVAITAVGLQASSIDTWTEQSSQYGTWMGTQQEEHLPHTANMFAWTEHGVHDTYMDLEMYLTG